VHGESCCSWRLSRAHNVLDVLMQTKEKERSRKNDVYAKEREGERDISNNNQIHNEIPIITQYITKS
jgi:hypothetical protein